MSNMSISTQEHSHYVSVNARGTVLLSENAPDWLQEHGFFVWAYTDRETASRFASWLKSLPHAGTFAAIEELVPNLATSLAPVWDKPTPRFSKLSPIIMSQTLPNTYEGYLSYCNLRFGKTTEQNTPQNGSPYAKKPARSFGRF